MKITNKRKKAPEWFIEGWKETEEVLEMMRESVKAPSVEWMKKTTPQNLMEWVEGRSSLEQEKFRALYHFHSAIKEYLLQRMRIKNITDRDFAFAEQVGYDDKKEIVFSRKNPIEMAIEKLKKLAGSAIEAVKVSK